MAGGQAIRVRRELSTGLGTRGAGFGLPPELLQKFRGRVQLLSLIFLVMCVAAMGVEAAFNMKLTVLHGVYLVNGTGSLALYLLARNERLSHGFVLNSALAFEIVMCLAVSLGFAWVEVEKVGRMPWLTWVCIVMVLFPLIVPSPPRRTLITAVGAAATVPMSGLVMEALGKIEIPLLEYVSILVSPVFCVPVAWLSSRVVYGLSRDVAEARKAGAYELTEEIGGGGMGQIWRAEHEFLARPAAVKLIRPEALDTGDPLATETIIVRFEQEVQATALLRSPHTIDVYDFGIADDGSFYYVMELLDGLDLQTLVDRHGPQSAERVVYIMSQVCASLEEAHARGLVHRDVKPANIILCRYGLELDFVKVLDFGLVKELPRLGDDSPGLTRDDRAVGTPSFMAPEMAVATTAVDGRADIYALGCVGYWLLTGRLVFEAESAMAVVVMHARDTPAPPSARTELEIPPALEALIMACLEKDPTARPQSARELRERLLELQCAQTWTTARMERWWERHAPRSMSAGREAASR